ncbi:MAG: AraC family transcriptional regulator [Dactylosporangium sp.]|nr:helix-turn-helix domain-containing protein [Dactylosporangium sp.]NNJ62488.1 AraC family transcriptional regulator [Dactylosporangium sp.]
MYQDRLSRIAGVIVWRHTTPSDLASDTVSEHRVLPDGCMDLVWTGRELLIAGPDSRATFSLTAPGHVDTGVRFAPGTGPAALGVRADEVRDRRVPLAELWPGMRVRWLTERLAGASEPATVLEELAAEQRNAAGRSDPVISAVVAGVRAGTAVADVAAAVGVSQRRLHRICLAAFGYSAKTLAGILRMDRAVALARRGVRFAEVAALTGYADQAHLARQVRALAGVPLGQLVRSEPTVGP